MTRHLASRLNYWWPRRCELCRVWTVGRRASREWVARCAECREACTVAWYAADCPPTDGPGVPLGWSR